MKQFALRGRQNPKEPARYDRVMLIIGGLPNRDPVARREEMQGFDFTDKSSIALVVELAQALPSGRGKLSRLSSPPFDPAPVFDRVCRHLSDIYILDM